MKNAVSYSVVEHSSVTSLHAGLQFS